MLILNFIDPGSHRTPIVGIFVGETCNSYRTIFCVLRLLIVRIDQLAGSGKKRCPSHLTIFFPRAREGFLIGQIIKKNIQPLAVARLRGSLTKLY